MWYTADSLLLKPSSADARCRKRLNTKQESINWLTDARWFWIATERGEFQTVKHLLIHWFSSRITLGKRQARPDSPDSEQKTHAATIPTGPAFFLQQQPLHRLHSHCGCCDASRSTTLSHTQRCTVVNYLQFDRLWTMLFKIFHNIGW